MSNSLAESFRAKKKRNVSKFDKICDRERKKVSTIFLRPLKSHLSKKFKSFLHLLENEQFDFIVAPERGREGERERKREREE